MKINNLKMNKFLSITLLAIISLNCFTAQKSSVAKDFLSGFFKIFDEKFSIDACMGEPITDSLNHLLEDLREKKINAVIEDFKILIDAVNKNCPVEDVKKYINAKKAAIEEGYYFENLKKNYLKVGNIVIIEVNNKDRSAYSIGVTCAEIEKLLIFKEQIRHLTFLDLPDFPKLNLNVNKNTNNNNNESIYPNLGKHSAYVFTEFGTIQLGGIFNNTIDNNLYLYNISNKWEILKPIDNEIPIGRYGHNLFYFENLIILFGGKDINNKFQTNLYVFDLILKVWIDVNYQLDRNDNNYLNLIKSEKKNNIDETGIQKFQSSGLIMENINKLIIFGGSNDLDDKNIYFLNLKNLKEFAEIKGKYKTKKFFSFSSKEKRYNYDEFIENKLKNMWTILKFEEIMPRFGLSITQINSEEILFFGGIDRNMNPVNTLEILNLKTFSVNNIKSTKLKVFPEPRGFHNIQKIGPILILIGGAKDSLKETFGDIWKFSLENLTWTKVDLKEDSDMEIFLRRKNFIFTKIFSPSGLLIDKITIYGGYGNNFDTKGEFLSIEADVCDTNLSISSKVFCFPCSEGFVKNQNSNIEIDNFNSKCTICPRGYYQDIGNNLFNANLFEENLKYLEKIQKSENENFEVNNYNTNDSNKINDSNNKNKLLRNLILKFPSSDKDYYFYKNELSINLKTLTSNDIDGFIYNEKYLNSMCLPCPKNTYNPYSGKIHLNSCKLCKEGFFNNLNGQPKCFECNENQLCPTGSINPIENKELKEKYSNKNIIEKNYPDFLDQNMKISLITKLTNILIIISINLIFLTILTICYFYNRRKVINFLICMDFLVLTGGREKKANGGFITLTYFALVISFTIFLIIRYIIFNTNIEIISLTHSISEINKKDFSVKMQINLLGNINDCINQEIKIKENLYECHPNMEINIIEKSLKFKGKFSDENNFVFCSKDYINGICKVIIECKECSKIKDEDEIEIFIKNKDSFVQAFNWEFESFWNKNFDNYEEGYSKISSSFQANNNNEE
jgi:hypothetical protein